ncbi:MAG TPA: DUF4183 domain-containing protein [Clostridiales bacterium]|nr:DUF4183 domain-containing protein [Clostridiales bacterium]
MARLFKLAITAETVTTVTTEPDVKRYFYNLNTDDVDEGVLTIPAGSFVDDQDNPVDTITEITPGNGFYLLFINGVLQQSDLYTVSSTEVVVQDASTIEPGSPIVLVVTNFATNADSQTTINT